MLTNDLKALVSMTLFIKVEVGHLLLHFCWDASTISLSTYFRLSLSLFLLISLRERFCCIFVCNNCCIWGYVAAKRKKQVSKVHLIMYTPHDLWIHVSFFLRPYAPVCSKTFPYRLTYCYNFSNLFPLTFTISSSHY